MNWRAFQNPKLIDYAYDLGLKNEIKIPEGCTDKKIIRKIILDVLEKNVNLTLAHPCGKFKECDLKRLNKPKILEIVYHMSSTYPEETKALDVNILQKYKFDDILAAILPYMEYMPYLDDKLEPVQFTVQPKIRKKRTVSTTDSNPTPEKRVSFEKKVSSSSEEKNKDLVVIEGGEEENSDIPNKNSSPELIKSKSTPKSTLQSDKSTSTKKELLNKINTATLTKYADDEIPNRNISSPFQNMFNDEKVVSHIINHRSITTKPEIVEKITQHILKLESDTSNPIIKTHVDVPANISSLVKRLESNDSDPENEDDKDTRMIGGTTLPLSKNFSTGLHQYEKNENENLTTGLQDNISPPVLPTGPPYEKNENENPLQDEINPPAGPQYEKNENEKPLQDEINPPTLHTEFRDEININNPSTETRHVNNKNGNSTIPHTEKFTPTSSTIGTETQSVNEKNNFIVMYDKIKEKSFKGIFSKHTHKPFDSYIKLPSNHLQILQDKFVIHKEKSGWDAISYALFESIEYDVKNLHFVAMHFMDVMEAYALYINKGIFNLTILNYLHQGLGINFIVFNDKAQPITHFYNKELPLTILFYLCDEKYYLLGKLKKNSNEYVKWMIYQFDLNEYQNENLKRKINNSLKKFI
jgi:hypothetical protein